MGSGNAKSTSPPCKTVQTGRNPLVPVNVIRQVGTPAQGVPMRSRTGLTDPHSRGKGHAGISHSFPPTIPFPAILELWLPFRGLTPVLLQPQLQDRCTIVRCPSAATTDMGTVGCCATSRSTATVPARPASQDLDEFWFNPDHISPESPCIAVHRVSPQVATAQDRKFMPGLGAPQPGVSRVKRPARSNVYRRPGPR
jgi:hypothetical protein